MKKAYLFIVKNWKTTIIGILTSILTYLLSTNKIDNNQYELILGLLISIGYVLSKDGDKSLSNNTLEEKVEEKVEEKLNQLTHNK